MINNISTPSFEGRSRNLYKISDKAKDYLIKEVDAGLEFERITAFTDKTQRLINKVDNYIEDLWKDIRKRGTAYKEAPQFMIVGERGKIVTIKPIYGYKKELLMSIEDGKYVENFIIDREHPDTFRYERRVYTDYGSATLKSFNNKNGKNKAVEDYTNEQIMKYFPQILPKNKNFLKDMKIRGYEYSKQRRGIK